MNAPERDWVDDYRKHPSPENLLGLLKSCQDPVYNVCFQVLRHPQDAEDAAQEALLKVLEGLRSISGILQFEAWMYRVALNTALNHRKRGARRQVHETRRPAMTLAASVSEEVRGAVHEALARLDDDSRSLVLQHYFEQRSLEDLGRQRGCSAVAVWKRIDKAKDALKSALKKSGLASVIPSLGPLFQSIQPAAAPAGLLSEALLAKAALVVAPASGGAAASLGGLAMTAKGVPLAALVIVSAILFLAGIGGGYWLKASSDADAPAAEADRSSSARVERKARELPAGPAPAGAAARVREPEPKVTLGLAEQKEALSSGLRLLAELTRQKEKALKNRDKEPGPYHVISQRCIDEWRAIRRLAYDDPASYFAFLRAPENKDVYDEFLNHLADAPTTGAETGRLPQAIVDGLVDLIATGTDAQKCDLVRNVTIGLFNQVGAAGALLQTCFDRIAVEKKPEVLGWLINSIHMTELYGFKGVEKMEGRLDVVREVWQNNSNWQVREQVLEALSRARSQPGEDLFIEKLGEALNGNDKTLSLYLPQILSPRLQSLKPGEEDRYIPVFKSAFTALSDPERFISFVSMSLSLSLPKAVLLLNDAQARGPTPEIKAGIGRALELIQSGETRVEVLQNRLVHP